MARPKLKKLDSTVDEIRNALEAAKAAVAEGEAIVRQAHEQFGFAEHKTAGPMERAWQRRKKEDEKNKGRRLRIRVPRGGDEGS